MEVNDGGPAFPCGYHPEGNSADQAGMSLRDWFAGQALVGIIADQPINGTSESMAKYAYVIADAMLKARQK